MIFRYWPQYAVMILMTLSCVVQPGFAQSHDHHHGDDPPIQKPRVFLDKSPRAVAYQLKRLSNARLLLVDRDTDDPKYAPVYRAILLRGGMSPQNREEALAGLVHLNASSVTQEVLAALGTLKEEDRQQRRTSKELASLLLAQPTSELAKSQPAFVDALHAKQALVRSVAFAGLLTTSPITQTLERLEGESSTLDLLSAVPLVSDAAQRNALRPTILGLLNQDSLPLRRQAILALQHTTANQDDTFVKLAPLLSDESVRPQVVRTLLTIPATQRDPGASTELARSLVQLAEDTPAAARTDDEFLASMQLADQLLALVPDEEARQLRNRLRAVTVRVIVIHTVEEEMRYDLPYFAVEAGRPVQILLRNEDLMPHNLVVTTPGNLQEVAELGLQAGPANGLDGKQYVPQSEHVLFATNMVAPAQDERLTFTAPEEPGEYPYVCTFPRHWMRMYGVMVVVKDLDAWLRNPVEPKDPIGSNRPLVKNWRLEDFDGDLAAGLQGRSPQIGQRLFQEATCLQCHKANGVGGAVGPELTGVLERWKGDHRALLRELLEPSHRIDPKYAMHLVITEEGTTISGIVAAEDKQSVSLITNPESREVTKIDRKDIAEMVKTSTSMMPKGLLDRFTKDEIMELLAYVESLR